MIEEKGNLWTKHAEGNWIVIPTNGCVNSSGHAIMGRGLAKECKDKFTLIPQIYGEHLRQIAIGLRPLALYGYRIILLPTKNDWREDSSITLIKKNAQYLADMADFYFKSGKLVYLPHLGCGEGNLKWDDVREVLKTILDDRFVALEMEEL